MWAVQLGSTLQRTVRNGEFPVEKLRNSVLAKWPGATSKSQITLMVCSPDTTCLKKMVLYLCYFCPHNVEAKFYHEKNATQTRVLRRPTTSTLSRSSKLRTVVEDVLTSESLGSTWLNAAWNPRWKHGTEIGKTESVSKLCVSVSKDTSRGFILTRMSGTLQTLFPKFL